MSPVVALLLPLLLPPSVRATPSPTIALRARAVAVGQGIQGDPRPWRGRVHLLASQAPTQALPGALRVVAALGEAGRLVSVERDTLEGWRSGGLPAGMGWLGALEPRDRVHPDLWDALRDTTEPVQVRLRPFGDVPWEPFQHDLRALAPQARCQAAMHRCLLTVDGSLLAELANWDPVGWLEPRPPDPVPVLDGAMRALGVNEVRPPSGEPPSYPLSGQGVLAAIWDPDGPDVDHPDLAGRVLRHPSMPGSLSHATQVAGVLGGSGAATEQVFEQWAPYRWTGAAPGVEFAFFLVGGIPAEDLGNQIQQALDLGAHLGSHSYKTGSGGNYGSDAAFLDEFLSGSGGYERVIPFFWAAANDAADEGYQSLADYAAAKAVIVVGATNANDDSLADFSSLGPTADGRLKPDVMAPGCYDTLRLEVEIDNIRAWGEGAELAWEFETDGDAEGWSPVHDLDPFTVEGGLLHTRVLGRDPYMHSPDLEVETDGISTVEATFHASEATAGQLFWQTSEGDWHEDRHLAFFQQGEGQLATVTLDVAAHEAWTGTLTGLRLDPAVLGVTVPDEGGTYTASCGTSLAAPAVAGVAALMLEAWFAANPDEPWGPAPAVFKAALVATAHDLEGEVDGTNPDLGAPTPYGPGPDYATGYGLVDAPGAVAVFQDHNPQAPRFAWRALQAETDTVELELEVQAGTLQVALAWDDPPGEPMASDALQNDLELRLTDPDGQQHLPWVLDPEHPEDPATTGENHRDNLEVVTVEGATPGIWSIQVSAQRLVSGPQDFALVAALDAQPLPLLPPVEDSGLDTGAAKGGGGCGCGAPGGGGGGLLLPLLWALVGLGRRPRRPWETERRPPPR